MQDNDVRPRGLTRRRVLGGMGIASLALMSSRASAQQTVDLHVPGGPSTRTITTSYPQKGRMILQRSSPPWLETPFEVFDKGVFTPNDQHYVSWHRAHRSFEELGLAVTVVQAGCPLPVKSAVLPPLPLTSDLPRQADRLSVCRHVSKVPIAMTFRSTQRNSVTTLY